MAVNSNNEFAEERIDHETQELVTRLRKEPRIGYCMTAEEKAAVLALITEHEESWIMVERYCESFKDNDWRIVLKRGDEIYEFSVDETVFRTLGGGDE